MSTLQRAAIVTGASQGIGFGIANYLAGLGYEVLMVARNAEKLTAAAKQIQVSHPKSITPHLAAIDVSDYAKVKEAVENFQHKTGRIDLLCNNAGSAVRGTSTLTPEEFAKMINTNLIGTFNFIQTVTPFMKKNKSGRIINIASRSGKIARKVLGGYAASKFGVVGFSEALCKELISEGIYVTAICPGFVATDATAYMDVDPTEMVQVDDIVKTVDYLLHLSPSVVIQEIMVQCKIQVAE